MKLAVFHDEINKEDPARAIQLAVDWGVTDLEVRNLPGGRFPRSDDGELEAFYARVQDAGLQISALSPGLFKCAIEDPSIADNLANGVPRVCEWAQRWGANRVSEFGFLRVEGQDVPSEVIDRLGEVVDKFQEGGCSITLENVAGCWGSTGREAAKMIRQVGTDRLSLCWDPGNSARAGASDPFPEEYAEIKDLVTHVHAKSYFPETGAWGLVGDGMVDWEGQMAALEADGFDGYVVVETHLKERPEGGVAVPDGYSDLEANTYHNFMYLKRYLEG